MLGPAIPPQQDVEQWTEETCQAWVRTSCVDVTCTRLMEAIANGGWGIEARFVTERVIDLGEEDGLGTVYGWAAGSVMAVASDHPRETFMHELTHILIDRLGILPWNEPGHHKWMRICSVPF